MAGLLPFLKKKIAETKKPAAATAPADDDEDDDEVEDDLDESKGVKPAAPAKPVGGPKKPNPFATWAKSKAKEASE